MQPQEGIRVSRFVMSDRTAGTVQTARTGIPEEPGKAVLPNNPSS